MADRKRTEADWQDVCVFLALARHGSLSASARALGVTHATVSRRLRSLEESLGAPLVERRPEGYVLTPAGTRAVEAASDMEVAARTLGDGAIGDAPGGLVRINAPPGLAAGFLTERLAALAARHVQLDLDLATNLRSVSLDRHEADIAIRVDRPRDGDMVARRLVTMGYGFDEADAFLPEAAWLSHRFPRARLAFRAGNQAAQAVAARTGVGIALLPHYIGRSEPRLRPVELGAVPPPREVFLLTRSRDRRNPAIRAVADALVEMFAAERALFE